MDTLTTLTYRGSDDCLLYATTLRRADEPGPAGGSPVIVLLHGGGPDHRSLLPLAERLADAYNVVLPDIRGYG